MGLAQRKDERVPADIKPGTFLGGMYQHYGVCKFCRQTRMMAFNTDSVPQKEVDEAATMACDCYEAVAYQRVQRSADKAKENLRTLNEQMNAHFEEDVEEMCDKAIDLIAAGTLENVSMKVGNRQIILKRKSDDKIDVCIKRNIKANLSA